MNSQMDFNWERLLTAPAAPRPLTARLSIGSGIATIVVGLVPGGIGTAIACNVPKLEDLLLVIVAGLMLWSLIALVWGLWYVLDRSPRYVLDEAGLADHTGAQKRLYPWSAVARATLHRSTRRGAEQSATLTLYLNSPYIREREVELDVSNLDQPSEEIFRAVGKWANLQ
jgi:hypothetical protein